MNSRSNRFPVEPALLLILVAFGLWMRFAGLLTVQHLQSDQGRDYLVVMDWFQNGEWPLLGPLRSYGGYNIGPGWFYTVAPLMVLSGYNPASGPGTIILLSLGMQILAWSWVRRVTGSKLAALVAAAALALGSEWVINDRVLWNPNTLPFAVVALACLLESLEARPLFSTCGLLLLCMVLPQWHTAGLLAAVAAMAFAVPILWRVRWLFALIPRHRWILAGCVVGIGAAVLYVPPVLYEITSPKSNLVEYFGTGYSLESGPEISFGHRLAVSCREMLLLLTMRFLGRFGHVVAAIWGAVIAFALSYIACITIGFRRRAPSSLRFLLVLPIGYWLGGAVLSREPISYQYSALAPVPVLFLAFLGGRWLHVRRETKAFRWRRGAGVAVVSLLLILMTLDVPASWRVHSGFVWYGSGFQRTQAIVDRILNRTRGIRYSFLLVESGNSSAHFQYLLRLRGHSPANRNLDTAGVKQGELGDLLVLVTRGRDTRAPVFLAGYAEPFVPESVADANVYWIQLGDLPAGAQSVSLTCTSDWIEIEAVGSGR